MKNLLEMDDIRPGMYVTVFENKEKEERPHPFNMGGGGRRKRSNNSYKGEVMEVLAINMPYAVVIFYGTGPSFYVSRRKIDLRNTQLMRIDKEYIISLIPEFEFDNKDKFWKNVHDDSLEQADTTIEDIFEDL